MSDIFLSYAQEDRDRVRKLAAALEGQGWTVFWDPIIPAGETWRGAIRNALEDARCVVVAWSRHSVESHWVCEEAEEGRERRILVPVLLDDVKQPMGFRSIQAASLVGWDGQPRSDAFRQLVYSVAHIIGLPEASRHPSPEYAPEAGPTVKARVGAKERRLLSWAALCGALAVIAGWAVFEWKGNDEAVGETRSVAKERAEPEAHQQEAGESLGDCSECPEMVRLPRLGIAMGKYEVTQAQWRWVMGENPSYFQDCGADCPVESVSYDDVQKFIERLNRRTGRRYRLPIEEEWQAACQAGRGSEYCGAGDVQGLDAVAWYGDNSNQRTHPVGRKRPNTWGLYDMSGNVWEWTSSCWDGDCGQRVIRGGSWFYGPAYLRSAGRNWFNPDYRIDSLGFRLAQD